MVIPPWIKLVYLVDNLKGLARIEAQEKSMEMRSFTDQDQNWRKFTIQRIDTIFKFLLFICEIPGRLKRVDPRRPSDKSMRQLSR
jgi:hypothetical protein